MANSKDQAATRAAIGKARLEHVEEKIRRHDLVREKSGDSRRMDETSIQLLHELTKARATVLDLKNQGELAFSETIEDAIDDPV